MATPTTPSSGKNLSPNGGDKPEGELAAAIDDQFGSFDKFRAHFTAAATTLQGSGWAILAYDAVIGSARDPAAHRSERQHPAEPDPHRAARHVGARLLPGLPERQARLQHRRALRELTPRCRQPKMPSKHALSDAKFYLDGTAVTYKDIQIGAKWHLLIASLVIVGTVVLSSATSFGLSVLFWQHIFRDGAAFDRARFYR